MGFNVGKNNNLTRRVSDLEEKVKSLTGGGVPPDIDEKIAAAVAAYFEGNVTTVSKEQIEQLFR